MLLGSGCDGCGADPVASGTCRTTTDCRAGQRCVDGHCLGDADGGAVDGAMDASRDAAPIDSDAGPDLGPCGAAGECQNDSRCTTGRCIPWSPGGMDDTCRRTPSPGPVRPQLQCVWSAPPAGDPLPGATHVLHTPLVANLGIPIDPDAPTRPNVIFISDDSYREGPPRTCEAAGILRVIDGATCRELGAATDAADRVNSSVTPAVGDLDGDGRPEIVAAAAGGGIVAFEWSTAAGNLVRRWQSHLADGSADLHGGTACLWGGVTLVDLTDDGHPEIVFEGGVWAADGTRLATVPGWTGYPWGVPAVLANVDDDPAVELVAAEGTWQWDGAGFVLEAGFTAPGTSGFTALADFGDFPGAAGDAPGRPEVVVVAGGNIWVQSLGGTVVRTYAAPSIGGGPPTIADYDGDGMPEIGAAFADDYVVYDPVEDRALWTKTSQDHSSARTGSSVFDFNADGRAEVVYGDECYVRVYDGLTGDVLFSQARFSSTWEENPIVADVDGDSAAEIVMGMSNVCAPTYCPMLDPIFAGLRCDAASDCPGGTCDAGLCRCTMDAECGDTYACAAPLAGTAGAGNVCRARHLDCQPGLRIYRDARDRWASSRPIWNQHAYDVTDVNDDGTVPRTSARVVNWTTAGLNNFRQNGQGALTDVPGPDLTVGGLTAICETMTTTRLGANVCNRGAALTDFGVEVIFRQMGGAELCRLRTTEPIPPGTCRMFDCVAPVPADGTFEAVVDPDSIVGECLEDNNLATGEANCVI